MYGMNGWCKEIPGGDLISRAAAIVIADSSDYVGLSVDDVKKVTDEVVKGLKQLPSAQPERKRGKWIDYTDEGYVECPFCHSATNCDGNEDELHFCFSCGADMRWYD